MRFWDFSSAWFAPTGDPFSAALGWDAPGKEQPKPAKGSRFMLRESYGSGACLLVSAAAPVGFPLPPCSSRCAQVPPQPQAGRASSEEPPALPQPAMPPTPPTPPIPPASPRPGSLLAVPAAVHSPEPGAERLGLRRLGSGTGRSRPSCPGAGQGTAGRDGTGGGAGG